MGSTSYCPGPANPSTNNTLPFHLVIIGSHAPIYSSSTLCFPRVWGSSFQRVVLGGKLHLPIGVDYYNCVVILLAPRHSSTLVAIAPNLDNGWPLSDNQLAFPTPLLRTFAPRARAYPPPPIPVWRPAGQDPRRAARLLRRGGFRTRPHILPGCPPVK